MHCPNCGKQTSTELKFCRACGMKLDSVAQALNQHNGADVPAVQADVEKRPAAWRINTGLIGIILAFIGIMIGVAGQGMWGAKSAAVVFLLLGILLIIYRYLPIAARYDREVLRSVGNKQNSGRNQLDQATPELKLPSGSLFEPAIRPSVTEGTTKDLDKNKTKVFR